jgi:hypothetical protein
VSTAEQLEWEARLGRPAALAAFGAALLGFVGFLIQRLGFEDRPGVRSGPDALLSINDSPATVIAGAALAALGALLLALVFYYLFRATVHRVPSMPSWFVYLVFAGPVLYAIAQLAGAFDQIDLAEKFADRSYSFPDADPKDSPDLTQCPAIRGALGDACAEELARNQRQSFSGLAVFGLLGPVLVAFLFVMLPLRARRAGLLSPFISVLAFIAGVLIVIPLVPVPIIQAFWLGAIGALFLGYWPGGRGPAWESGTAEPWPSPAQRRGLVTARDEPASEEADIEPDGTVEPEPPPQRPSSRKRKRKRR